MTASLGERTACADAAASEILFGRLLELSNEAVFLLSPAGRLMRLNAAAERLLGVRAADFEGQPYQEWPFALYDAEGQALGRLDVAATVAAARQQARLQFDLLIVNAVGERQAVRARLEQVTDAAGDLLCFMAVVAPLPPSPHPEPRAAYLQQVLNALPTGLAIIESRKLLEANDAFNALMGLRPGELNDRLLRSAEFNWYLPDGRADVTARDRRPVGPVLGDRPGRPGGGHAARRRAAPLAARLGAPLARPPERSRGRW